MAERGGLVTPRGDPSRGPEPAKNELYPVAAPAMAFVVADDLAVRPTSGITEPLFRVDKKRTWSDCLISRTLYLPYAVQL